MKQRKRYEVQIGSVQSTPWLITYADMMSLLLVFFIMLTAFSSLERGKFNMLIGSLRNAFGYDKGPSPIPQLEEFSGGLFEKIRAQTNLRGDPSEGGGANQYSPFGENLYVTTVREGLKITIGGKVLFNNGDASVTEDGKKVLNELTTIIKGYNNRIEIRGHTSSTPLPSGSPYKDLWDLSWQRARSVAQYLAEKGADERTFRICGMSKYDPIDENIKEAGEISNSRVELIVSEEIAFPLEKGK